MQQLKVSHSAIRNRDGISYNTATYKESDHIADVHKALTRSKAAEPLLPFLLSHPSRFLFFLFPVAYACANNSKVCIPHSDRCTTCAWMYMRMLHVVTLWYPSYVPASGHACIQHELETTGAKHAHASRQCDWCRIADGKMCTRVQAHECLHAHAQACEAQPWPECAAAYLGGCSWGSLRGGGQGQAPTASALFKQLCCLVSQVAVGPGLCDCVEVAG